MFKIIHLGLSIILIFSLFACQSTRISLSYSQLIQKISENRPTEANGELLADLIYQASYTTAENYKDKTIQTTTVYPKTQYDTFSFINKDKVYQIQYPEGYSSKDPNGFIHASCTNGEVLEVINLSYAEDNQYEAAAVFDYEADSKKDLTAILAEPIIEGISLNGIEIIREFPNSFYVWKEENDKEKNTIIHWQIVDWNQLEAQIASSKFAKVGMIFPRDLQAEFKIDEKGKIIEWNSNDTSGTVKSNEEVDTPFWVQLFENKPKETQIIEIS